MTKRVVSGDNKVETDGSSINHRCGLRVFSFFFFLSFFFFFFFIFLHRSVRPIDRSEHYFPAIANLCRSEFPVVTFHSSIEISFTSNSASVTWNASYIRELFVKGVLVSGSKLRMGRETRRNSISNASSNDEMRKNLGVKFGLRGDRVAIHRVK